MHFSNPKYYYFITITLFSLLFIVPFFLISLYNFSGAADDMHFAIRTPHLSYVEKVLHSYNYFVGRYFNAVFFSLPSSIFLSVWFAQLHPMVDLILLIVSFNYLIRQLGVNGKKQIWLISLVTIAISLAFMPNIKTLYWFSGSTVYFFPLSGLIFIIGLLIKDFKGSLTYFEYIILLILVFAVCGSNEIFMVYVLYSTFLLFLFKHVFHKKRKTISLITFLFASFCTYLVITSPGTKRRFDGEGVGNIIDVIGSLFPIFANLTWSWLFEYGLLLIPVLIIISGLFNDIKIKNNAFLFYITYAFTLILGGIFVITYSLGTEKEILPRVLNVFFIIFVFIIFGSGIYLSKKLNLKSTSQTVFWLGITFLFFAKSDNVVNTHNDLSKGIAKKAQAESIWRFKYLDTVSKQEVIMPKLTQKSKILMIPDWGKSTDWTNKHLATYFKKKSISVDHSKMTVSQYIEATESGRFVQSKEGFSYWFDKLNNQVVIQNQNGNISNRILLHIYPKDKNNLINQNSTENFDNFDFNFPKDNKEFQIKLPKYPIKTIRIGQFNKDGRLWSDIIIIDFENHLYTQ